jgi:transcriptional regulator GlxA family with amidase domain
VSVRRVVFAVFPDFQVLDLTGPHEVFAQANRLLPAGDGYRLETVAAVAGPVRSSGGLLVEATGGTAGCTGRLDTLVVVGGPGTGRAYQDAAFTGWLAAAARRSRRVASVCSGAFLLARAGLLAGRRAVTHWGACDRLAALHPEVTVEPDPIFVRDGEVWTSAGVTAGIDLALAMVEDDRGAGTARAIARQLVMFVQRPGGQVQFSAQLAAQRPARGPVREVQGWLADHLDGDLSVPVLAGRAGMSERNFTRVFAAETGRTPGAYVESARVEAARRLLETTAGTVESIARRCGFGTAETLHRSFKRTVGVTPGQYRHHFGTPAA